MDSLAEDYVKIVLAVGQHDPDYVDAYYGPQEWRPAPGSEPQPIPRLRDEVARLLDGIPASSSADEPMEVLRREYLSKQLQAVDARLRILAGERLTFDEESRALYDAVAPTHSEAYFARIISELDERLPGAGPVTERYEAFKRHFIITRERL